MYNIYLPPLTHVSPLTVIRRELTLPRPGTVLVRLTQKVQGRDVVAECEGDPVYVFLDAARGLGVEPDQVSRYMIKERDIWVEEGDILAQREGLSRRSVRSPGNGRIVTLSGGRILFEQTGEQFRLRAGFPGTVVETDGIQGVILETVGALIQGTWGNHGQDFGVMRMVGEGPDDRMTTSRLDINLRGAILVAGVCDGEEPLRQAAELTIRGLILGSMEASLIPFVRTLSYPVVVTDGFGNRGINAPAFDLLSGNIGREAAVLAYSIDPYSFRRPEVVIPLPAASQVNIPEEIILLEPGVRVRILRSKHTGEAGMVREILPDAVSYPSGIRASSALVDLGDSGTVTVPLANLEVLQ
ncbi:MAG: hypothetical protein JXA25_17195 [Anaerolineales bacterium]|nr:hypothetical protein [Anaerolineales bacterium]